MKIFGCLCPAASSHSMLCFDAFARDQDLPLGSNLAGLLVKNTGVISVDTVTCDLSDPGLTEDSAMHLWSQCLSILNVACVAK